jgi:chloramphenicol-sensitive protein RarD
MKFNKYFLSALISFIIWGFFSLALKPLKNYPSLDILFYRVFFATFFLIIINLIFRKKALKNDFSSLKKMSNKQKIQSITLTVCGGFLLIVNWFIFIYAINHVSLQSTSFAYMICPILTTILAFFILNEKLNKWQWFSVILCIISCFILSYGHLKDLLYSLSIALSFAFYLITQRKNNQFDRFVILTIQMLIASIVIAPFFSNYTNAVPTEISFYLLILLVVVVFTIIPLFLNLYALKGLNSSTVGILMYTNPLIHFLLAFFYFNEEVKWSQIFSYTIILLSIVIFNQKYFVKKHKFKG